MASSSTLTGPFRKTLLRVSDTLSKKNVHDLAFRCAEIAPARREEMRSGTDLFTELQAHDLLNEAKVDLLIEWLGELQLAEASKFLEDYRDSHLQSVSALREKCAVHKDLPLRYYCVSCNRTVCPECVVTSHGRGTACEVIGLDKISEEISSRRVGLIEGLEDLSGKLKSLNQLWEHRKEEAAHRRDATRKEATSEYLAAIEAAERQKRAVMEELDRKEISDTKELLDMKKQLQDIESNIDQLRSTSAEPAEDNVPELERINEAAKEVDDIKTKLEQIQTTPTRAGVTDDDADGRSGGMIGSVGIEFNQIVNLSDERATSGGVLLVCVDPGNPGHEYWRHLVKVDDNVHPVVMSNIAVKYDFAGRGLFSRVSYRKHVLFAVGKTVYTVRLHWSGSLEDYVESASPIEIDAVPAGSWVTGIAGCSKPSKGDEDEFLISISGSSVLREYKVSGSSLRSTETKEFVTTGRIRCVSYVGSRFAIIEHGNEDVTLITHGSNTVAAGGKLRPPTAGMIPIIVICINGGKRWLVLFTNEVEKRWQVASYDPNLKMAEGLDVGTSNSASDLPVSIARRQNKGYITFPNGDVRVLDV